MTYDIKGQSSRDDGSWILYHSLDLFQMKFYLLGVFAAQIESPFRIVFSVVTFPDQIKTSSGLKLCLGKFPRILFLFFYY
jgi:hypothetical protein